MKSQEFFDGIWNKAVQAVPENARSVESKRLLYSIVQCIGAGESDLGYVRNALGYDSELPSTEKDGKEHLTKKSLFQKMFARALNEARVRIADATAREVWKVNFRGSAAQSVIMAYANAVERDSEVVKFIPPKSFKPGLVAAGHKAGKNNMFVIPVEHYTKLVLNRVIPPYKELEVLRTELKELTEKEKRTDEENDRAEFLKDYIPRAESPAVGFHEQFKSNYRTRLSKHAELRSERMTEEFSEIVDDMGIEW